MSHGCFFHRHNTEDCLRKKKFSPEISERGENKFKGKIEKFLKETDLIEIYEVIWECEWEVLKKLDEDTKYFMNNTYIKRPLKRLVPRDSLFGGSQLCNRAFNLHFFLC